jgi:class 3 adenylate cyclase
MLRRFLDVYRPNSTPELSFEDARPRGDRIALTLRSRFLPPARLASWSRNGSRLMAALYADLVGYSLLFHRDDTGTIARLRHMHRLIRPAIRWHRGRLVQTAGDSFLVTFDSIGEAVKCAVAIQYELARHNDDWPDDSHLRLRVGLDLGDVIRDGRDYHGSGVIVAVRLQEACPPGGVCVSRAAHERGGERLGLPFEPMGALLLKNVPQPVEAFVLRPPPSRRSGLRLVE